MSATTRPLVLLGAGLAAAGVAAGVRRLHRVGGLPGGSVRWERTNHAGQPVTLTEGVALTVGAAAPLTVLDPPAALAVLGAGLAGAVDDLYAAPGDGKGLRGHLGALARGRVTTGALKIALLGASGLVACAWADRRAGGQPVWSTVAGAGLVAGTANLANLLDLRPGRALKVFLALAAPLAVSGSVPAAATLGAGASVLPDDLRGRSMLGDTGANPLGAAVGLAAARAWGPRGRLAGLGVVAALTLLSEKVSFTSVIESTPVLRELDRWGRPG